ncbi:winged helix-turn-helix transcriptional regulator [Nocardia heshunensis]
MYPTVPPRVGYTLTESGHALRELVHGMCDWTHRYLHDLDAARTRFDGLA